MNEKNERINERKPKNGVSSIPIKIDYYTQEIFHARNTQRKKWATYTQEMGNLTSLMSEYFLLTFSLMIFSALRIPYIFPACIAGPMFRKERNFKIGYHFK